MRTALEVLTPWLCRNTMMSRTAFCSAQPVAILPARNSPIPDTSCSRLGSASMTSKVSSPNWPTIRSASLGPMPGPCLIQIASHALLCRGWRGLQQVGLELQPMCPIRQPDPDSVDISPAEIEAACPTRETKSRLPRAFTFRTAKPVSMLWKVTRSTLPTNVSRSGSGFLSGSPRLGIVFGCSSSVAPANFSIPDLALSRRGADEIAERARRDGPRL